MQRYMALYGPNTHQFWIYDEEKDVYIDPPLEILKEIEKIACDNNYTFEGMEKAQKKLEEIANTEPDWLHDGNEYSELEP